VGVGEIVGCEVLEATVIEVEVFCPACMRWSGYEGNGSIGEVLVPLFVSFRLPFLDILLLLRFLSFFAEEGSGKSEISGEVTYAL
jgi:hypothetical protein